VSSCEKLHRTVEEVAYRRDTLWAIAERRGFDLGEFGVFRDVCAVLTDDANAVRSEQDRAAGVEPEFRMPDWEPSGLETWQRLPLCEQVLTRPARRADCVVWLRLAPTHLPQYEVTHGQVRQSSCQAATGSGPADVLLVRPLKIDCRFEGLLSVLPLTRCRNR
jgi:hypothetical protein